ncbi:MAG TPA: ATP-binding protein [Ferruginibacter sp.]|nr:ATP-binding protein [Ferruginibacter sp.]
MGDKLILGREEEKSILDSITASGRAELVAVYGRRRVGKTYLINTYLDKQINFHYSGVHGVETAMQLQRFTNDMSKQLNAGVPIPVPADWFAAFDMLQVLLQKRMRQKKVIVFLDEFPWMQTPKSNFLAAFENFWNTWAAAKNNIAVILCGSAAGWMIQNIVRNKGGLHNRITRKIPMLPFNLYETELFLKSRRIQLNRYQITQLYMAMGGIPQYLSLLQPGLSAAQLIDRECFSKNGFLYNEFDDLYRSLFDNADRYMKVIRALAAKPMGMTRNNIIKTCKLQSGGSTTSLLEELSTSGFITAYTPFGKKIKDSIYVLTDEYSLFYLKFIEPAKASGKGAWLKISETPSWKTWSGLAFETLCYKHTPAIKVALGIPGIYSEQSSWKKVKDSKTGGSQIDMVIDRRDHTINICEIKFYNAPFHIDKKYAAALNQKLLAFREQTKTRKHVFLTLISTFGIHKNEHSIGLVDKEILMDDLFIKFSYDA